jgi:hypothetical protein
MLFMRYLFTLLVLFCCGSAGAQNFSYSFRAEKVTFSGAGYINIRNDSGVTYTGAHWLAAGTRKPVGYISGNVLTVAADFSYSCANAPDSVTLRGLGTDTIDFPALTVPVSSTGAGSFAFSYPATPAVKGFAPGIVDYYAPFLIRWQVSMDKGLSWLPMDTTDHKVYVTKGMPMGENPNFRYFHTVLELSCRNAKGKSADTGIIKACWNEFTDQIVLNHNGDRLQYYNTYNTSSTNLPALMRTRDAQCYTFAQLFLALLKIQGIVRTNNYVFIESTYPAYSCGTVNRFLVKNWKFGKKSDSLACPDFPYKNTYTSAFVAGGTYSWVSADVTDLAGVPGQCNVNPASFFNNHQVVKLDGVYYDACYGLTFSSLTDIKTRAFDGWGIYKNLGGGSLICNFSPDISKADLQESISTY